MKNNIIFSKREALVRITTKAAQRSERWLLRDFGELNDLQSSPKGAGGFVTAADRRSENIIRDFLIKEFPTASFLMEESGLLNGNNADKRFVVDALDGTSNFMRGIPYFAVSIAVQSKDHSDNWETVVGVVNIPLTRETFIASKGEGAASMDQSTSPKKIKTSNRTVLKYSITMSSVSTKINERFSAAMAVRESSVRCSGSTALDLTMLASGKCDIVFRSRVKSWDILAGMLIAKEAGCFCEEVAPGTILATSSKSLMLETKEILDNIRKEMIG